MAFIPRKLNIFRCSCVFFCAAAIFFCTAETKGNSIWMRHMWSGDTCGLQL